MREKEMEEEDKTQHLYGAPRRALEVRTRGAGLPSPLGIGVELKF